MPSEMKFEVKNRKKWNEPFRIENKKRYDRATLQKLDIGDMDMIRVDRAIDVF